MKLIYSISLSVFFAFYAITGFATARLNSINNHSVTMRLQLMQDFKSMYEHKHFSDYLFNLHGGYLQTSVGNNTDKMPLNFFIQYNNMWWFSVINKVVVPAVGYDPITQTGFIILNIYYDKNHIFRGMQYVKFVGNKITYIRTYASPTFFSTNLNDPLVRLDSYGNQIWLTTGYNLTYSVKAALLFFQSPVGKSFATNSKTQVVVQRIKANLKRYLN